MLGKLWIGRHLNAVFTAKIKFRISDPKKYNNPETFKFKVSVETRYSEVGAERGTT